MQFKANCEKKLRVDRHKKNYTLHWCVIGELLCPVERGMARQQRRLQQDLSSEEGLEIASGVMVERKMRLEKGYHQALAKTFWTHPHQVDFTKPDQAVTIINAWISDHTAGTYSLQLIA